MVDFAAFLGILRRGKIVLLVAALLGAVLAIVLLLPLDGAERAEVVASVRFEGFAEEAAGGAHEDGYYLIEAERRFGDALGMILTQDAVLSDIGHGARVVLGRASRISPLDYRIPFTKTSETVNDEGIMAAFEVRLTSALSEWVMRSGEPISFSVTTSAPAPIPSPWTPLRAGVVGAILGIVLAIFFLLLRHAAKPEGIVVQEVVEMEIS